ncbi:radical SAM protein [Vibrio parahaemolyticus]|uniref:radical SAM protein n=1 Tax=Vibrio parahaemolyticus TaxID=670 RepID=UPI001E4AF0D1|nr:radical SAM protein [Vibrio parahaemolyticus]HCE2124834.1 radical SAM protein [Vibrio parahaemolyticus]
MKGSRLLYWKSTSFNGYYKVLLKEYSLLLSVNELGLEILKLYFDDQFNSEEILNHLYTIYRVDYGKLRRDIIGFLKETNNKIKKPSINNIFPSDIEINITSDCNLRCKHCFISDFERKYMSLNNILSDFEIANKYGIKNIRIIGGEPFKHPDINRILESAHNYNFNVNVSTNGISIDNTAISILKKGSFQLSISVDGLEKEHDFIRGKGSFSKTILNINRCKKQGIPVAALCTINNKNINKLDKICDFFIKSNTYIGFSILVGNNHANKKITPKKNDLFDAICNLDKISHDTEFVIGITNSSHSSLLRKNVIVNECSSCINTLSINVDNNVSPCPFLVESGYYTEDLLSKFNDEFIQNYSEIKIYKEFKENIIYGCQARNFADFCDVKKPDYFSVLDFESYLNDNLNIS